MGSFNGKPTKEKITESDGEGIIRYGTSSMQGWRLKMEDSLSINLHLPLPYEEWSYFGIFDGHGGSEVAETCSTDLLNYILETDELKGAVKSKEIDDLEIANGIKKGFLLLDKRFVCVPGGTTVSSVLITPEHFIFINCGDSRGFLMRSSKVYFSTTDHKPTQPSETERIIKAGGEIIVHRLNGNMSVSRSLGDSKYKGDSQLLPTEQLISPEPDVYIIPRDKLSDQIIVLACDGVWDVFNNEDIAKLILTRCACSSNLGKICEEIIDAALYKGSKDNISIIIITLENAPKENIEMQELDRKLDEEISTKTLEYFYSEASDISLTNLIEHIKGQYVDNLHPGEIETKLGICVSLFENYISSKPIPSNRYKPASITQ